MDRRFNGRHAILRRLGHADRRPYRRGTVMAQFDDYDLGPEFSHNWVELPRHAFQLDRRQFDGR